MTDAYYLITTYYLLHYHYHEKSYFRIEYWHIEFWDEYLPWNKNEISGAAALKNAFMKVSKFSWQKLLSQIYQK